MRSEGGRRPGGRGPRAGGRGGPRGASASDTALLAAWLRRELLLTSARRDPGGEAAREALPAPSEKL